MLDYWGGGGGEVDETIMPCFVRLFPGYLCWLMDWFELRSIHGKLNIVGSSKS
jgi:hypothetical protein